MTIDWYAGVCDRLLAALGIQRLVPFARYEVEAREVFDRVKAVRDGKSAIDARIEATRTAGNSLWE